MPLIGLGVIKKGWLSPCLPKDSAKLSGAARWGSQSPRECANSTTLRLSASILQLSHSPTLEGFQPVVWLWDTKPLEKLPGTAEDFSRGRAFTVLELSVCTSPRC